MPSTRLAWMSACVCPAACVRRPLDALFEEDDDGTSLPRAVLESLAKVCVVVVVDFVILLLFLLFLLLLFVVVCCCRLVALLVLAVRV